MVIGNEETQASEPAEVDRPRESHAIRDGQWVVTPVVATVASALLGLVAFVALARATPRLAFYGDVAQFQLLGLLGGLAHANGYPVYITLANLFALLPIGPLSEAAYRINLLSAVLGGVTVALLSVFVARVGGSVLAGLLAGLAFLTLGATWALSTVATPYTLDTTLTLAIFLLLGAWATRGFGDRVTLGRSNWPLCLGLFLWGLSFGGHDDTLLLAPGVALLTVFAFPWRSSPRRAIQLFALGSVAFLLGFAIYLATWFFQDSRNVQYDFLRFQGWIAPNTWVSYLDTPLKRFWYQASNQEWRHAFLSLPMAKVQAGIAGYFSELPGFFSVPGLALIALGLVGTLVRRPRIGLALLLVFAAQLAFWFSYDISDLPKHLLPSYLLLATWLGLGVAVFLNLLRLAWGWSTRRSHRTVASSGSARVLAALVVAIALGWLVLVPSGRNAWLVAVGQRAVDYQPTLSFHVPKNLTEAETSATQTVSSLPANAVIFTEWQEHFTLGYVAEFQLERSDILMPRTTHFALEEAIRVYTAQGRTIVNAGSATRGAPTGGAQPGGAPNGGAPATGAPIGQPPAGGPTGGPGGGPAAPGDTPPGATSQ